jgi:hypothetical protein
MQATEAPKQAKLEIVLQVHEHATSETVAGAQKHARSETVAATLPTEMDFGGDACDGKGGRTHLLSV